MRVAAAHEPLSDEEAPPVEAADLHDVALHTEEGASPPSASNATFPLHDGGHVVTINVTQYTDQPGSGGVAVAVDVSHGKAAVNKLSGDDDEQEARLPRLRCLAAPVRHVIHEGGQHAAGGRNAAGGPWRCPC